MNAEQGCSTTTTVPTTTSYYEELPVATTVVCQEDDACWDCTTTGNGQCGPDPTVTLPVEVLEEPFLSESTTTVDVGTPPTFEPGLVPHFVDVETTVAEVSTAYELPATGSETVPLLGGGLTFLVVGVLCLWARRPVRA
mgnify:CR=1 FL=1